MIGATLAASCGRDDGAMSPAPLEPAPPAVVAPLPALIEEPFALTIPTYEGSGESVHPDVLEFPNLWRGHRYWLAMTPYPRSDYRVENPSVLQSDDGVSLAVPEGGSNPVVPHAGRATDYNSDPELVYEPETDRLLLFYRFVEKKTNTIRVASSLDGRTWKRERNAFWVHGHAAVSPSITPRFGTMAAKMWYVDAGKAGCHAAATRVMMRTADSAGKLTDARWSAPTVTDLVQPGYVVWHLKVRYIPTKGEFWALYSAFPKAQVGCDIDDLFFARSTDGVHWQTYPEPLIRHEDRAWTAAAVYRSTFLYIPETDELRIWLSARGAEGKWSLGLARFRYTRAIEGLDETRLAGPRRAPAMTLRGLTSLGDAP
jgi:hypothetical protein